ncbi:MAG TPA: nuclear transport factor 2 family protein [Casimicrobiaceae bacterium]|nr:nuclear transport factor 2 family protein [Casimicrobiaceae bacterium]
MLAGRRSDTRHIDQRRRRLDGAVNELNRKADSEELNMDRFKGKDAGATDASSQIGKATATAFNEAGDKLQIAEVIQRWGLWRDQGQWEKLATTFHPEGTIEVSWFNGRFEDFIAASRKMRATQRGSKHEIAASRIDVLGRRAVAETNVRILGRHELHGVECDSTAWGRFYDFLEKRDRWAICRRVALYEKDRVDPVMPSTPIPFDAARLAAMPKAYRFLGYSLALGGFPVSTNLPIDEDVALEALLRDGEAWLKGDKASGPSSTRQRDSQSEGSGND